MKHPKDGARLGNSDFWFWHQYFLQEMVRWSYLCSRDFFFSPGQCESMIGSADRSSNQASRTHVLYLSWRVLIIMRSCAVWVSRGSMPWQRCVFDDTIPGLVVDIYPGVDILEDKELTTLFQLSSWTMRLFVLFCFVWGVLYNLFFMSSRFNLRCLWGHLNSR